VLVEVPFYPLRAVFENATYVVNSTAHWRPIMNGYSGHTPRRYQQYADAFARFPAAEAIQAMKAAGVTHVMVHPERLWVDREAAKAFMLRLSESEALEQLAIGAQGITLYRLR
jgi:hypothetical protein